MHANDDEYSSAQNLSVVFKFFHANFSTLYVNTNGLVSFLSGVSTYTSEPFPGIGSLIVLAPFWADVDIRYCNSSCNIWYRESDDLSIINKATSEIQQYFPDMEHFIASWTYIATWYNVPFYGASAVGLTKRNTFQCVLITNGLYAFVIFNYNKIEWTTGTASGGNSDTGLDGTPAQVGFNMGDQSHYYSVEGSRTSDILNLTNLSNVKYPGKFLFRVDLEEIEPPDIDWCIDSNCQNGGTCVDGHFDYTCLCTVLHNGSYCESDIDWCIDSKCQNDGTCIDGLFDHTCLCPVSHTGVYCESDIDFCELHDISCGNGGTCVDGLFDYSCACPLTHTGYHCETGTAKDKLLG
ncbi:Alpha-tectorin [Mytilus coruscus]|uniref:Alpha-tectorin n=1 Tax=Mytilus coruscus TaxID=42192 RepID=A0A6J8DH80_MYTCO|nr:Alpha-tectorin [Mytilus coruscus]